MKAKYIWHNGALAQSDQRSAGLLDHGLHYGTGVFEGIRCYQTSNGPAVFRLEAHLERMKRGGELIGMEIDTQQLTEAIFETLAANKHQSAYIRPLAYYANGGLGLDVDPLETHVLVATLPWKSHLGDEASNVGVRLHRSKYQRISSKALPPAKLCGVYVNSVVAKLDSKRRGFDEALFLDDAGMVCECTGENLFAVFGNEVVAVQHPDALDGITRSTVINMTGATQRPLSFEELLNADEVFLTGTSAEVAAVSCLDDRTYGVGSLTREIMALYQDVVHGKDQSKPGWLSWVA
jgi:branched-chain amino acid aminotransferase